MTSTLPPLPPDDSAHNASSGKGARGHILVIDDEPDIRESLEVLLSSEGYRVELAGNATEGLKRLESSTFDLVLLDLMMPDKSGMEVLEEIRVRDRETPIFLITAYGSVEVAVTALKRGANDYRSLVEAKSGMEVLEEIRVRDRETPIFLITAYGSVEVAVTALKRGANDY